MLIKQLTITEATNSVERIRHLLSQLSSKQINVDEVMLKNIILNEGSEVFIAIDKDTIAGMLTLVTINILTGTKCLIEDVVVDADFRGKGIGRSLVLHAIDMAKAKGASQIDLTSRPSRVEANELYKSLGFERAETNFYRKKLDQINIEN